MSAENKRELGLSTILGLGALVAALTGLVVWSLPKEEVVVPLDAEVTETEASTPQLAPPLKLAKVGPIEASCELAILSDRSEEELKKIDASKLIDAKWCGSGCDAVKELVVDKDRFDLDVTKAEDYMLPPKETFETVAASLTPSERDQIEKKTWLLVVKAHGKPDSGQVVARTCFAITAAAADDRSFVYDEAARRIETAAQTRAKVMTAKIGQSVFEPKHVTVQVYKHDDGNMRLVTHGLARFGSPDLVAHGVPATQANAVANILNAAAGKIALLENTLPMTISLHDVARVTGKPVETLVKSPLDSKPIVFEGNEPERTEGDPDDMVELIPPDGSNPESWDAALAGLFGERPQIVGSGMDPELETIATKARADLPKAIERWKGGDGTLFLKAPFTIPSKDATKPPGTEWMWIETTSCEEHSCAGTLSNTPGYATNLAAGKTTAVDRAKIVDFLLRSRDGAETGGASIKLLEMRAKKH